MITVREKIINDFTSQRSMERDAAMDQKGVRRRRWKRTKYEDVDGSFRKFEGAEDQNIFEWMQAFDLMCKGAEWNEFEKVTYLRRSLKDVAYDVALIGGGDSYDSVKEVLLTEFGSDWKQCNAIRRIVARRKKMDETALQYMTEMRRLGKAAKLDDATVAMFVVDGLDLEPIWKFALSRITDLVELRKAIEGAERCIEEHVGRMRTANTKGLSSERQHTHGHGGEADVEKDTLIRQNLGRVMIARREERRDCSSDKELRISTVIGPRYARESYEAVNEPKTTLDEIPEHKRLSGQTLTYAEKPTNRTVDAGYEERRKCYNCNFVGHLSINCPRRHAYGRWDVVNTQRTRPILREVTASNKGRRTNHSDVTPSRVRRTYVDTAKDHDKAEVDRTGSLIAKDHSGQELMVERVDLYADVDKRKIVVPQVDESSKIDRDEESMSGCTRVDSAKKTNHDEMMLQVIPSVKGVDRVRTSRCSIVATVEQGMQIGSDKEAGGNDVQVIVEKDHVVANESCLASGRVVERKGIGVRASVTRDNTEGIGDSLAWAQMRGYVKAFRRGFV